MQISTISLYIVWCRLSVIQEMLSYTNNTVTKHLDFYFVAEEFSLLIYFLKFKLDNMAFTVGKALLCNKITVQNGYTDQSVVVLPLAIHKSKMEPVTS